VSNNSLEPLSHGTTWDEAWKSVRRLAKARQGLTDRSAAPEGTIALKAGNPSSSFARNHAADEIVVLSDRAQHAFAEIESASTALRNAQPDLEPWFDAKIAVVQTKKPSSVWLVVGAVWISTVLLVAIAMFALAWLLR
jgi:hypothetical protein